MNITVTYKEVVPESVTLYLDGVCAHNEVIVDTVEDHNGHYSEEMFCTNCDAWFNDMDGTWTHGKEGYLRRDRFSVKAPF